MKKYINIASAAILFIGSMAAIGCSSETDGVSAVDSNVGCKIIFQPNLGTRAVSDSKTTWIKNDKIFVLLDGNLKHSCRFTYTDADGLPDWKLSYPAGAKSDTLYAETGTFTAVYADSIEGVYDTGLNMSSISTYYDVLYGINGTYTKTYTANPAYPDIMLPVVMMNIDMDKRPLAKIRVNGMPAGFSHIKGLREYILCDMTKSEPAFRDSTKGKWGGNTCTSEGNGNYTFYGTLSADSGVVSNGATTISLVSNDGKSTLSRTYSKTMAPGDYIIVKGPQDSIEASQWACNIKSDSVTVLTDTTFSMNDYVDFRSLATYNENATFTGGQAGLAAVTSAGTLTTTSATGSTVVNATAASGLNMTSAITVKVSNLEDILQFGWINKYMSASKMGFLLNNLTSNTTTPIPVVLKKVTVIYPDGTYGAEMEINETIEAGVAYQGYYTKWNTQLHSLDQMTTSQLQFEVEARDGKTYIVKKLSSFGK